YPFLMEKPMGINAAEVEAVAAKAARLDAFVAVPLAQRYTPFATRARELLAVGRFGPLSHIYVRLNRPGPARYQTWDCAWMLDPAEAGGGCLRNLGPHGLDMFLHLTGEEAQVTGAQLSRRAHGHVRPGGGRAHAPSQRGRRNPCHARGDWEHAGATLRPDCQRGLDCGDRHGALRQCILCGNEG